MDAMFGGRSTFNMQTMLKMNDIPEAVQYHLVKVYCALAGCVLAATVGVVADLYFAIGGMLSLLGAIGVLLWMGSDKSGPPTKRVGMLLLFGFLKGTSLGPLVDLVLMVDPSILITATLATTLVFVCFSISALLAKRRSYLYLGGILGSLLSFMLFSSLINMFVRSPALFDAHLYIGLLVFCGYVLVDTQMVVEKAVLGDRDFAWHAVELFIDFVAIFVRICIILLKNSQKGKQEKKSTRR